MSERQKFYSWRGYLGDGAYVKSGRYGREVIVCTSDGIDDHNEVYLTPEGVDRLAAILTAFTNSFNPPPPGTEEFDNARLETNRS